MHLITAFIRPERLSDVKAKLTQSKVYKLSVSNALGHGDESTYHETYRGADVEIDLHKRVRLEIAVNEEFVEKTVKAILEGAKTPNDDGTFGAVGDGKVFVSKLEDCYRIRNEDRGADAIG